MFSCLFMQRCTTYLVIQGNFGRQLAVADCGSVSYLVIHGTLIHSEFIRKPGITMQLNAYF